MPEPPDVRRLELSRSFPFVGVKEAKETRSDHATVALLMLAATLTAVADPTVPSTIAIAPSFIMGYATNNWLVYGDMYGGQDDD